MRKTSRRRLGTLACICTAAAVSAAIPVALASSHREAPGIAGLPRLDATDLYAFRSYESGRSGFVTIIADYIPLQAPYGGPNFFQLDPNAVYEIHIDNNADAKEDITFQFQFKNTYQNAAVPVSSTSVFVPLINIGAVSTATPTANVNLIETYTCNVVLGDRRAGASTAVADASVPTRTAFQKPLDFVGTKTFGSAAAYESYARSFIHNVTFGSLGQGKVFVGQRKEPFAVSLGPTFDLVNFNPLTISPGAVPNPLDAFNVTSICIEVPISTITSGSNPTIGVWTTSSLPQARVLNPSPVTSGSATGKGADVQGGALTQVSRLGHPLVNEVVIGLPDKDKFNASQPKNDATNFLAYVTNPSLPKLLEVLFGSAGYVAPAVPRTDLVTVFLTGVPGVNQPALPSGTSQVACETLRLNTSIGVAAKGNQKRLGVLESDNAGFPNGRRPGDDVVDIELRVAAAGLANATSTAVADGVFIDDQSFDEVFPYLKTPNPGS